MPMACTPIWVFQAPQHLTATQNLMHTREYGNESSQVWSEYNAHSTITKNTQFYELNVVYKIRPGFMQLEESRQTLIYWPLDSKKSVFDTRHCSCEVERSVKNHDRSGIDNLSDDFHLNFTDALSFHFRSSITFHMMNGHSWQIFNMSVN